MNAVLYSGLSPSSIYTLIYTINVISQEGKASELLRVMLWGSRATRSPTGKQVVAPWGAGVVAPASWNNEPA